MSKSKKTNFDELDRPENDESQVESTVPSSLEEAHAAAMVAYEIVGTKAIDARKDEFVKAAQTVKAYAESQVPSDPENEKYAASSELTEEQVETFNNLANACRDHEGGSYQTESYSGILDRVNWQRVLDYLLPILLKFLAKEDILKP